MFQWTVKAAQIGPCSLPRRYHGWPFPHLPASERQPLSVSFWLGPFIIGATLLDWHRFLCFLLSSRGRQNVKNVGKVKWKKRQTHSLSKLNGAKPDSRLKREAPGIHTGSSPVHINMNVQSHNACSHTCKSVNMCMQASHALHTFTARSCIRAGNLKIMHQAHHHRWFYLFCTVGLLLSTVWMRTNWAGLTAPSLSSWFFLYLSGQENFIRVTAAQRVKTNLTLD